MGILRWASSSSIADPRALSEMNLVVHKADDALYLRLDDSVIVESDEVSGEVSNEIILDDNAEGKVVGIEVPGQNPALSPSR